MALNDLFCADMLQPLDLVPLTDFTYKYYPDYKGLRCTRSPFRTGQSFLGDDLTNEQVSLVGVCVCV